MRFILERGKKKKKAKSTTLKQRYMDGKHFKEMECPDKKGTKNRFCGCVRYQMALGKSEESAKKICGYIKSRM